MSRTNNTRRPSPLRLECLEEREVPAVIYAVTNSQRLLTFDSSNPSALLGSVPINNLSNPGEKITDIDVRPGSGGLYGRSSQGRIYLINPLDGFATLLSGVPVPPGASVATDFDPTTDRLRVTNFSGGNVAVNPSDGTISDLGNRLTYVTGDMFQGLTPRLAGLAFTNSAPFASTTQLFGIDQNTDTLVTGVGDPNGGTFLTVGSLGIDVSNNVGFDIDPNSGLGFATFQAAGGGGSFFAAVNLTSGAAAVFGPVGPAAPVILDIAVSRTLFSTGNTLPPVLNLGTTGFATTDLLGTIFGPTGPNLNVLPGVNPAVLSNLISGINAGGITSMSPSIISGLSSALNSGLINGIDPTLVSGFNSMLLNSGFFNSTGLNGLTTGVNGLTTGLTTGLTGATTGLNTGLTGLTSGLTTGLNNFTSGLTTGINGFANPLSTGLTTSLNGLSSGLTSVGTGLNTGLNAFNSGLNTFGTGFTGTGTLPTSSLNASLVQPLSAGLVSNTFNPFAGSTLLGTAPSTFSGIPTTFQSFPDTFGPVSSGF